MKVKGGFSMKKSLVKGRVILQLEKEIKQYGNKVIYDFVRNLELKGAPIIEDIENESGNKLVTFIYEGDNECQSVLFVPEIGRDRYVDNYKHFRMERIINTNLWYITYEIEEEVRLMYFFSPNDPLDNDWNGRFANRLVHDKFNKNIFNFQDGDKGSYIKMPSATEFIWTGKEYDVHKGNVEEYEFQSNNQVDKRRIRVYTPFGYDKEKKDYCFMVLTDGNDYIHTLSAIETLDKLIGSKKIPPIIAVFIDSIEETRSEELMCNDSFCKVIAEELISWIRQKYNISENPEEGIICGLSLGGLTAAYLGLNYFKIFGNVLSQSGAYWYRSEGFSVTKEDCWIGAKFKELDRLPLKFYIDVGVFEHKEMIYANLNLRDILLSKGYSIDFQWFNSSHDYLSWGETLAHGLISLIGTKHISEAEGSHTKLPGVLNTKR